MSNDEKNKKLNQKFKNVFSHKILSATWEKDGIEVSILIIKHNYYINSQRREIDEMIKEMAEESISLFCLRITEQTDIMFQIFKDIYEEKKPNNTLFQIIDNIENLSFSD